MGYISCSQVALILNVSEEYVERLLDEGKLPWTMLHREVMLREEDILEYKRVRDRDRRAALDELTRLTEEYGGYDFERNLAAEVKKQTKLAVGTWQPIARSTIMGHVMLSAGSGATIGTGNARIRWKDGTEEFVNVEYHMGIPSVSLPVKGATVTLDLDQVASHIWVQN